MLLTGILFFCSRLFYVSDCVLVILFMTEAYFTFHQMLVLSVTGQIAFKGYESTVCVRETCVM